MKTVGLVEGREKLVRDITPAMAIALMIDKIATKMTGCESEMHGEMRDVIQGITGAAHEVSWTAVHARPEWRIVTRDDLQNNALACGLLWFTGDGPDVPELDASMAKAVTSGEFASAIVRGLLWQGAVYSVESARKRTTKTHDYVHVTTVVELTSPTGVVKLCPGPRRIFKLGVPIEENLGVEDALFGDTLSEEEDAGIMRLFNSAISTAIDGDSVVCPDYDETLVKSALRRAMRTEESKENFHA